jgi:hypothetical protein
VITQIDGRHPVTLCTGVLFVALSLIDLAGIVQQIILSSIVVGIGIWGIRSVILNTGKHSYEALIVVIELFLFGVAILFAAISVINIAWREAL